MKLTEYLCNHFTSLYAGRTIADYNGKPQVVCSVAFNLYGQADLAFYNSAGQPFLFSRELPPDFKPKDSIQNIPTGSTVAIQSPDEARVNTPLATDMNNRPFQLGSTVAIQTEDPEKIITGKVLRFEEDGRVHIATHDAEILVPPSLVLGEVSAIIHDVGPGVLELKWSGADPIKISKDSLKL